MEGGVTWSVRELELPRPWEFRRGCTFSGPSRTGTLGRPYTFPLSYFRQHFL